MGCCGKGNKVDPEEAEKPKATMEDIYERELVAKRHNCTDVICLGIFIGCCVIQFILAILIFVKGGDPANILLPTDSAGNACKDKTPVLFYFNLMACASISAVLTTCSTPSICVASCPTTNLFYLVDSHRENLLTYCDQAKLAARYSGTVPTTVSETDYFTLAEDDICPPYVLNSKSYYSRCLPAIITEVIDGVTNTQTVTNSSGSSITITDTSSTAVTDTVINEGSKYIVSLMNLKTIYRSALEDFNNAKYMMAILITISVLVTFMYIVVMRWILAPMIYASLALIVVALSFIVYYCIDKYLKLKNNTEFKFTTNVSSYFNLGVTWLVLGIIAGIFLIVIILLIIALIKRIRVAIKIIAEASKAVTGVFISLFFPIFPLMLEAGVLIYFISVSVFLSTAGQAIYRSANSTNATVSCTPSSTSYQCYFYAYGWDTTSTVDTVMKFLSEYQWLPHIYNLFMFYWIESFIVGFNQMVLAGTFGIWYWSKAKSSCILFTAWKDTSIYHLGSIAFGSLLIAIVKLIRFLIDKAEKKLQKAVGNNPVTKCIIKFVSCCCKCFFWCLEKFLKFISKNAYIMVAIYGRNFCVSAVDALKLLMANPLRAAVLDSVSDFILFIGKLLITSAIGVLGFYFFSGSIAVPTEYKPYFQPDLHYYWIPLVCVILGTYVIASTFFSVFEMAIDTVFLCALKDMDIHDGSIEKPYFMSTKLLKIMDVKNSKEVEENERKANESPEPTSSKDKSE